MALPLALWPTIGLPGVLMGRSYGKPALRVFAGGTGAPRLMGGAIGFLYGVATATCAEAASLASRYLTTFRYLGVYRAMNQSDRTTRLYLGTFTALLSGPIN